MVEAILLNPPEMNQYGKVDTSKTNILVAPLGILYIAGYIREHNHTVKIIDARLYGNDFTVFFKKTLQEETPRFVGITCATPSIIECLELAEIIKSVNSNIKVVLGGHHPSALPKETIAYESIDIVIYGEGELAFLNLLENEDLKKIKGICYKENSKIIQNPPQELIENLDLLPWPAYDLLEDINKYKFTLGGTTINLITSRGCPYNCSFCSSRVINKGRYRTRSITGVVDEIEHYIKDFGIKQFNITDDTFNVVPKRVYDFCSELNKRKLDLNWWSCNARINTASYELMKAMKEAKCRFVQFGIESGNQEILNKVDKNVALEQIENAVKATKKAGLEVYGYFMLGLPFETPETARQTIEFAKKLDLDYAQFAVLTPMPGSKIWELTKNKNGISLLSKNWGDFKRYGDPIIETPAMTKDELKNFHKLAYKEFYFRPKYLIKHFFRIRLYDIWT